MCASSQEKLWGHMGGQVGESSSSSSSMFFFSSLDSSCSFSGPRLLTMLVCSTSHEDAFKEVILTPMDNASHCLKKIHLQVLKSVQNVHTRKPFMKCFMLGHANFQTDLKGQATWPKLSAKHKERRRTDLVMLFRILTKRVAAEAIEFFMLH